MNLIHKIRGTVDEAYRIRHGWGLSPIRNKREMKALIEFCQEQLKDKKYMKLNLAMWDVYKETVRLYKKGDVGLHDYINEHVGWYWS